MRPPAAQRRCLCQLLSVLCYVWVGVWVQANRTQTQKTYVLLVGVIQYPSIHPSVCLCVWVYVQLLVFNPGRAMCSSVERLSYDIGGRCCCSCCWVYLWQRMLVGHSVNSVCRFFFVSVCVQAIASATASVKRQRWNIAHTIVLAVPTKDAEWRIKHKYLALIRPEVLYATRRGVSMFIEPFFHTHSIWAEKFREQAFWCCPKPAFNICMAKEWRFSVHKVDCLQCAFLGGRRFVRVEASFVFTLPQSSRRRRRQSALSVHIGFITACKLLYKYWNIVPHAVVRFIVSLRITERIDCMAKTSLHLHRSKRDNWIGRNNKNTCLTKPHWGFCKFPSFFFCCHKMPAWQIHI